MDRRAAMQSLVLRRIGAAEAAVEATLTGSRRAMAKSLMLDGGVRGCTTTQRLTEALLEARAEHLPQVA